MTPTEFKGSNIVFGENQKEYLPLPALKLEDGTVITCWELTDDEIQEIIISKKLYFKQLTFNNPLQPILPMVNLADGYIID